MMAKPRVNPLIPLIFLASSLVPSYALYFLITVLYMHHIHRFWSLLPFLQARVHASPWALIQSWWNQPKFIHHPKLSPTVSHHPLWMWNYPLTTPSFPVYPNSIPTYPISKFHPNSSNLYKFFWKPTNQSSGGVMDGMAIHSPNNSPFTEVYINIFGLTRFSCDFLCDFSYDF